MSSRMERLENLLKGINELPDDLLIHILSFLTMKDAAKTSVLSKRWIFLWTYQPNLNFDLHTLLGSRIPVARYLKKDIDMTELDRCKFIKRVDQILQFYRGTKIDSFGVTFPLNGRSAQPVHRWISFVVKKGVEKLYLRFSPTNGYQFHYEECYIFPGGLISQENGPILKHLHLASCILCPPPIFCEFNSLITLHLEDMVLIEREMENVLSNSLKLESWTLVRCVLPNYFRVVGLSHTLKHLTIRTCNNVKKIELRNMNLETFVCIGCDIRKLTFRNVPHLVKANVESMLNDSAAPHAYQRAKDIRSLESITIDMIDMEALYLPVRTTTRSSLEQLQLKKMPEKFDLSFIVSIVDDASPFIQKLHLMLHPEPDYSDQRNAEKKWTSGNKHLREVEISGFMGTSWEQVEFVKHVVDYAVALDQLIIRQSRRTYYNHCEWLDYKPKVPWTEDERDMLFHTMQKHIRPDVKILIV